LRDLLRQNNEDLLRDIEQIKEVLRQADLSLLPELRAFHTWLIAQCEWLHQEILQNLDDLALGEDRILPNILSNTQVITRYLYLFNRILISPVIRARPSDRLCLRFLQWLHSAHPQSQHIPSAFSDGSFASWPDPRFPTIYFMPPSAQRRLLYLPLFFHEFGHLLYACHCDAVGLVIGGPAFAHSFSMYFRMLGRDEYHLKPEYLAGRGHPVTWLRIRLITDRARRMGFSEVATSLERTWLTIANQMSVTEDYYGFYVPEFLPAIQQTIDDMLEEASPHRFEDHEVDTSAQDIRLMSPVTLVNQAWHQFYRDAVGYSGWEKNTISIWLGTD
jgi:hypothetical protein